MFSILPPIVDETNSDCHWQQKASTSMHLAFVLLTRRTVRSQYSLGPGSIKHLMASRILSLCICSSVLSQMNSGTHEQTVHTSSSRWIDRRTWMPIALVDTPSGCCIKTKLGSKLMQRCTYHATRRIRNIHHVTVFLCTVADIFTRV